MNLHNKNTHEDDDDMITPTESMMLNFAAFGMGCMIALCLFVIFSFVGII